MQVACSCSGHGFKPSKTFFVVKCSDNDGCIPLTITAYIMATVSASIRRYSTVFLAACPYTVFFTAKRLTVMHDIYIYMNQTQRKSLNLSELKSFCQLYKQMLQDRL